MKGSGRGFARALNTHAEEIYCRMGVAFVTMHAEREYVQDSLALGPVGFVVKQRLALDLLPAVRSVLQGQPFVSPSISR